MMPPRCSSELHQTHLTEYPKRLQPRPSSWRWCPRLLKGRFRLTAPRGKGVVTCRNLEGWSAPAFFTFSDGLWLPPVWGHGYEPHRGGHGSKRPTTALNQKDRDPELMCRQSA